MRRNIALLTLGWLATAASASDDPPRKLDFDRDVAPILSQRCIDCHSGPKPKGGLDIAGRKAALAGGENGPALVPGNLDESLLWQRVDEGDMPPKKPLSDAEKAVLREWVASGGAWGTDPIDPLRFTTSRRAGYDWWSLRPVQNSGPPAVKNGSWGRNPIDQFVLAKLEAAGLEPSPEADRRTLIRRLSSDLIGLPPSFEEVEAFLQDKDPLAYEKLVDRLLASPHYGERWARHWLDIARFGESDGFERNFTRSNAWPYRDWLIKALNDDVPYDKFARLQIAGDVLAPDNVEAAKATGFLVAGAHNTVVGADAMMRAAAREEELEDIVGTFSQTFVGLTVHCARCHDHKFDPIPQADFYRIASSLGGVQHGERAFPIEAIRQEIAGIAAEQKQLIQEREGIEKPARRAILSERGKDDVLATSLATPILSWDFRGGIPTGMTTIGESHVSAEGAVLDGKTYLRSGPIPADLREKTLEAWVRVEDLNQRGGGVMSLQSPDGSLFDAIVFGEQEAGKWMAGSNGFQRSGSLRGGKETDARSRLVSIAMTYQADGTIAGYRDGKPYGKPYKITEPIVFKAGEAVVVFGCRHEPLGGNKMLAGTIAKARLYDRALTAEEIAASVASDGEFIDEATLVAGLSPESRARREVIRDRLQDLSVNRARLQSRSTFLTYMAVSGPAPVTRLLVRGQVSDPSDVVAPAGLKALGGTSPQFTLPPDAPDADRRRRLADWLTGPENPLFARVMSNRLWHYHFGVGLVETPNDFGFNGGRPSHPELLDWLASEFASRGFRMKDMHRLIVSSSSYRQSSASNAPGMAKDADNRLLWRKSPQRLEAEAVRDTILAASGLLNRGVGGRGFSDYRETFLNGSTFFEPIDPVGPEFQRRSIYRFLPRGANQGLLDTFDCPDPNATAPRRAATTTPIQALALWNDTFVFRASEALASRIKAEVPGDDNDVKILDRRIARAWQLLFQREPREAEVAPARKLAVDHGFKALSRALFNANEFLAVE